jgi:hypothetical protein
MEGFLFLPAAMSPHLSDGGFFIANEEAQSTICHRQSLSNGLHLQMKKLSLLFVIHNRMEAHPNGGRNHVQRL